MQPSPQHKQEAHFLSTSEFAKTVGISGATVKRKCDKGEIAFIVISDRGDRRIPRTELLRFLAEAEENRRRL
jgi:excisionase family DNA binding protein